MERRQFLIASTLAGALAVGPRWARAATSARSASLEEAAREAWLYGLMLIENAQARHRALQRASASRLTHAPGLVTHRIQTVTTPNNDTLYSQAWIDLSGGPVTLRMPETGARYVSYQFMDMYGNNFAVLGSRTTGGGAREVIIVGPNDANKDALAVRSPTRWVWLLVRLLTGGSADLEAANAIRKGMAVEGPELPRPPAFATRNDDWRAYFGSVQALLAENPPPITDLAFFERIAALGLGPTNGFDATRFSAAQAREIEAGIARARAEAMGPPDGQILGGWFYPKHSLGNFGQDYGFRARTALSGLAALTPVEAMYMRPVAADGSSDLPSATNWRLHFPAGQLPPVDAFWSLTIYQVTAEKQYFLFDHPAGRYSIGDRTPGLKRGADGSLDIWISGSDPGGERTANWLPSPPTEKLGLMLRAYLPKSQLLERQYLLPPVQRA